MNYRAILQNIFDERVRKNPSYSLRAFARSLNISHSYLSEVLRSKKKLSREKAESFVEVLKLSEEEGHFFLKSLSEEIHNNTIKGILDNSRYIEIEASNFEKINHWRYFALMSIIDDFGYKDSDYEVLGDKLSISCVEVSRMLNLLSNVGLIKKNDGVWEVSKQKTRVTGDIPKASLREFQKKLLDRAIFCLDNSPFESRSVTSTIFECSYQDLEMAKEDIKKFQRKFVRKYKKKKKDRKAYAISVALTPMENNL